MEFQKYTYISLLILSMIGPLMMSFESKIRFVKQWIYLIPAILIPGSFFIIWDALFTHFGIWSFNNDFVMGLYALGLPLEEWLFFAVIPFCSLFVYEVANHYLHFAKYEQKIRIFLTILGIVFLVLAIFNYKITYTFVTLLLNSIFIFVILWQNMLKGKFTNFIIAYFISSIPMLIVNGVLTSFPVVEYNPLHFSNLRLGTIPIEDFGYFLLLFQMNFWVFEFFKQRNKNN